MGKRSQARSRPAKARQPARKQPGPVNPVVSFLKWLPLTLLLSMVLWAGLRSTLDVAVSAFGQLLIRAFEMPRVTRLVVVQEHRLEIRRSDLHVKSGIPTIALTEIHFNTIVLLALFLALPRPWSRKQLERLFMGCCILYLSHTVNLIFHVKLLYSAGLGDWSLQSYSSFARNVFGFGKLFTDLPGRFSFPFLIWLGYNWDHVMVLAGTRSTPQSPTQAAPPGKAPKAKR